MRPEPTAKETVLHGAHLPYPSGPIALEVLEVHLIGEPTDDVQAKTRRISGFIFPITEDRINLASIHVAQRLIFDL